jgi:hypothetical protein
MGLQGSKYSEKNINDMIQVNGYDSFVGSVNNTKQNIHHSGSFVIPANSLSQLSPHHDRPIAIKEGSIT